MARIQQLDPHLAAKIAAGEVIERPASVVKELVENALDAGSRWIRVEVEGGGIDRISVSDDGCGIGTAEVSLAFRRHATSKIHVEDDLDHLHTLGFRGEALPSIAAVADVRLATRTADERVGIEYVVEAGAIEERPVARQAGTSVVVEHLFARFPARRKFLRARSVESAACLQAVVPLALAFPEVQFAVRVDGREALRTPGDGRLRGAAVAVLGAEVDPYLVDVPETVLDGEAEQVVVRVGGLCATGSYHRSGRSGMHVIVNRRPVHNRALLYAVAEAYGSLVPVGRQPVAVLNVEVPPDEVDFNVHPSKLEVKLLRERAVFGAVQRALRGALAGGGWPVATWGPAGSEAGPSAEQAPPWDPQRGDWGVVSATRAGDAQGGRAELLVGGERLEGLRVLGQAGKTYLIAEGDAGVYLVDQHAAHERVLLEELRASLTGRQERQLLLEPAVIEVPPDAAGVVETAAADLASLGFDIEPFGPRQVLLRAVPAVLAARQPGRILGETLVALATGSHGLTWEAQAPWSERLALVLACKTAVRSGDTLERPEMEELLRRLGEATLCRTCAHGRPTAILLSHAQLEREFGRR